MPHAALWVVQRDRGRVSAPCSDCFNAARGFVGGAARSVSNERRNQFGFNAARGFVGGATNLKDESAFNLTCFNAARGCVGGAT